MSNRLAASNPFYVGCTASELARLFDVPMTTVRDNISSLTPAGKRGNSDIYTIKDAARLFALADEDEAEQVRRILKLHHTALPKMLSKEFWLAETHRQKYMVAAGELWPTTKIVQWLSDAFKQMRLALMLLPDSVDRAEALTEKQREVIVQSVDATLNDAADRLVHEFENRRHDSSHEASSSEDDDESQEL